MDIDTSSVLHGCVVWVGVLIFFSFFLPLSLSFFFSFFHLLPSLSMAATTMSVSSRILLLHGLAFVQGEPIVIMGFSKSSSFHPVARRFPLDMVIFTKEPGRWGALEGSPVRRTLLTLRADDEEEDKDDDEADEANEADEE